MKILPDQQIQNKSGPHRLRGSSLEKDDHKRKDSIDDHQIVHQKMIQIHCCIPYCFCHNLLPPFHSLIRYSIPVFSKKSNPQAPKLLALHEKQCYNITCILNEKEN